MGRVLERCVLNDEAKRDYLGWRAQIAPQKATSLATGLRYEPESAGMSGLRRVMASINPAQ